MTPSPRNSARNTTRKILSSAAAIAILTTTSNLWAQTVGPGPAPAAGKAKEMMAAFAKADTNSDGKLDMVEAEGVPGLIARFKQVDTDGDGMVSKAEFEKAVN
jgi:hypothetical protein